MVKNDQRTQSLRGSQSSLSLRSSVQEQAARQRIAELEAQVAALTAQSSRPTNFDRTISATTSTSRPVGEVEQPNRIYQTSRQQIPNFVPARTLYEGLPADQRNISIPRQSEDEHNHTLQDQQTPYASLFEKYNETLQGQIQTPGRSLITKGLVHEGNALRSPQAYTQPFCDFLTDNPTVWHAVTYFEKKLEKAGFKKVCLICLSMQRVVANRCSFPSAKLGTRNSSKEESILRLEMVAR